MSKDTITVNMNVHDIPILVETLEKSNKEIERLHSIIKEVREAINKKLNINSDYVDYDFGTELLRQELLEILDKENSNGNSK